jgi:hypothetical protein
MNANDLREECQQEFDSLDFTLHELLALDIHPHNRSLSSIEKAGIALLMSNIYMGIENILKRICKFSNISLPTGGTSHLDLLEFFFDKPVRSKELPVLFLAEQQTNIMRLRKFRHRVMHGYGFMLEEEPLIRAVEHIPELYSSFRRETEQFLKTLLPSTP